MEMNSKILSALGSQTFYDWYNGRFEMWLTAHENAPSTEEIVQDIDKIFNVGAI